MGSVRCREGSFAELTPVACLDMERQSLLALLLGETSDHSAQLCRRKRFFQKGLGEVELKADLTAGHHDDARTVVWEFTGDFVT